MVADAITRFVSSIHNPALTEIGLILNEPLIFIPLMLGILLVFEERREKRLKILFAVAIALGIGLLANVALGIERPCADVEGAICPMLYSFPSIHSTFVFILMISFLNKKQFPYFMLFALFVAFTRINLEVHVFRDIAGGLIVGLLAYNIADGIWKRWHDG